MAIPTSLAVSSASRPAAAAHNVGRNMAKISAGGNSVYPSSRT
jgi:hypothetical protein